MPTHRVTYLHDNPSPLSKIGHGQQRRTGTRRCTYYPLHRPQYPSLTSSAPQGSFMVEHRQDCRRRNCSLSSLPSPPPTISSSSYQCTCSDESHLPQLKLDINATPQFIGSLTEMVWAQIRKSIPPACGFYTTSYHKEMFVEDELISLCFEENVSQDLESFSKYA